MRCSPVSTRELWDGAGELWDGPGGLWDGLGSCLFDGPGELSAVGMILELWGGTIHLYSRTPTPGLNDSILYLQLTRPYTYPTALQVCPIYSYNSFPDPSLS